MTSVLGGVAYPVIVLGPLVHSLLRPERVNYGMLALAVGFAVHQLFEGYTLYHFGPGSVLGALAVGYVIHDLATAPDRPAETTVVTDSNVDTVVPDLWPGLKPFERLYGHRGRNTDRSEE